METTKENNIYTIKTQVGNLHVTNINFRTSNDHSPLTTLSLYSSNHTLLHLSTWVTLIVTILHRDIPNDTQREAFAY